MKKIILSILILCITFFKVYSQAINPLRTSEQCPGVNITFTVTIAAQSIQSVQPKALNVNPTIIQQPFNIAPSGSNLIFNFTGRFADYNNKQTFTVFYTNLSGQAVTYDFTFIKIKSLLTANSFSQIFPNTTNIISPHCQINNHNISFANVQYGNPYEAPPIGFGTVTNYEYQLPAGWSIGSTTSNGSNWMAGGNNVIVTSNLATGDGGVIRIRPINSACGTGLIAGQQAIVSISRPKPSAITGGVSILCSGSSTYTLNLIPPGATVCWTLSNSNVASIPSSPFCGNSVTVTRIGSGNANTILTANVSDCSGTYPPINFTITVGTTVINSLDIITSFCLAGRNVKVQVNPVDNNASYTWSVTSPATVSPVSGSQFSIVRSTILPRTVTVTVQASNVCGNSSFSQSVYLASCSGGFRSTFSSTSFSFDISPNPAKENLFVTINEESPEVKSLMQEENNSMTLYDLNTNMLVKKWSFKNNQNRFRLSINRLKKGPYILVVSKGKYQQAKQVIIE